MPTETVYGLAADALNVSAVKKIFEAKGRPSDNPLIVHIAEFEELFGLVTEIPEKAKLLADKFWPGPLTLIFKRKDTVPPDVAPKLNTVAVRMPSHPVARQLIKAVGSPLAAPSANLSGSPSPTCTKHVMDDMDGRIPAVLDGGECAVGLESTVLFIAEGIPRLLRPGGITVEQIEAVIGNIEIDPSVVSDIYTEKAASPGMKYKHYSPKAKVTVVDADIETFSEYVNQFEGINNLFALCFDEEEGIIKIPHLTVGSSRSNEDYGKALFSALRSLDDMGAERIFAHCPQKNGFGLAVYNRLIRAAAFNIVAPKPYCVMGLTGTTGSGKSVLSKYLENRGAFIIDCDLIAHDILERQDVIESIVSSFGEVTVDGKICRKKLAEIAFSSTENTNMLNSITHPVITEKIMEILRSRQHLTKGLTVIDAPLLFEAGLEKVCDFTLAVTADRETRLSRIMARDGIDRDAAISRINAQKVDSDYAKKATYNVKNDGTVEQFTLSVGNILKDIGVILNGK